MKHSILTISILSVMIVVGFGVYLIHKSRQFHITTQAYFDSGKPNEKAEIRGWGIHSLEQLDDLLSSKGLLKTEIVSHLNGIDFEKSFLFVVENGHLEEMQYGAESVGYAKVRRVAREGIEFSKVIGPRNRPIKVFGDN